MSTTKYFSLELKELSIDFHKPGLAGGEHFGKNKKKKEPMPQASKHLNRLSCYFFNILKFKTLLKSANLAATGGLDGTVGGAENGIPQTELQGRFQYS